MEEHTHTEFRELEIQVEKLWENIELLQKQITKIKNVFK